MPNDNASRQAAITAIQTYFDDGGFERELAARVAIKTESQRPDSGPELQRYLDEDIVPCLRAMGFDIKIYPNPFDGCGPVLLATRQEDPALPTVLGYGHGDVIQGLDDQWTVGEGPWKIARDGDKLYGRGTADNKGQHTINIAAMRAVIEARGALGFNAKILIEMGEENGSRGLREIIEANITDFACDVFIGSDGPRIRAGRPCVSLGCRGACNFDLLVELRDTGHHSGNWGGLISSASIMLTHAIASMVSKRGEIKVPEWRPTGVDPAVRSVLDGLSIDAGPGAPTIEPDWGEPGLSPLERVYAWNSFDVLSMHIGEPGRPVNAVPPKAWAHVQLRYVVGTDPEDIMPAARRHLDAHGFDQVQVLPPPPENAGFFYASQTPPDHPWALFVRHSIGQTMGEAPDVIPAMGGSIGNELFTDLIGVPAIWVPHSYSGCSQHAPNEHLLMSSSRDALTLMAGLYWDLGAGSTP